MPRPLVEGTIVKLMSIYTCSGGLFGEQQITFMKQKRNRLFLKVIFIFSGLMFSLGVWAEGIETPPDASQSAQEPAKSIQNPNADLVAMAFKFRNTENTPKSYAELADRYCRAAKHGNAEAQYSLGWMYANGRGVPKDEGIATLMYAKAAEQGHLRAIDALANMTTASSESELPKCFLLPDPPAQVIHVLATEPAPELPAVSDETAALFQSKKDIYKLVEKLAPRYQIDTHLAMAFIAVESGFNARATSPKNAQGLMQLIPETAERFGVKNAYNAEDNIKGGLAYLRWLLAYFEGNVQLVAAAYNAGEKAVEKYKGVPPYAETQNYVQKIAKLYRKPSHPFREDVAKASPFLKLIKEY